MSRDEMDELYNHLTKTQMITYLKSHNCREKDNRLFSMIKWDLLQLYIEYKEKEENEF